MDKKRIVIHCTASNIEQLRTITPMEHLAADVRWWQSQKWSKGGYAVIIWLDGSTLVWKDGFSYVLGDYKDANYLGVTNGAAGYNSSSIHICYAGGLSNNVVKDTRTDAQRSKMAEIVEYLKSNYNITEVVGHRDLFQYDAKTKSFLNKRVAKACPSFDVRLWLSSL